MKEALSSFTEVKAAVLDCKIHITGKSPVLSTNIKALFRASPYLKFMHQVNTNSSWCDEQCFDLQAIRKIRMASKILILKMFYITNIMTTNINFTF